MNIWIELIKDNKVFLRIPATSKNLDKKLKEIKERYFYDDYNLIYGGLKVI